MKKKNIYKSLTFISLILLMLLFPTACFKGGESPDLSPSFSLWSAYWGPDDLSQEVKELGNSLEAISYFALYFKEDGSLLMPDRLKKDKEKMEDWHEANSVKAYLTIVNDIENNDGTSSLKNQELLKSLLTTPENREKHIREILEMTHREGFDGLEIDYEALKKDWSLWEDYLLFLEELSEQSKREGLLLRVVLEPSAPFDQLDFPEGPEYLLMCYNLHGRGTGPGPKADKEFLEKMLEKSAGLPGRVNYALSTGGFLFKENASVTALTESEVLRLAKESQIDPERDSKSQALHFTLLDDQGGENVIWFADSQTLKSWIQVFSADKKHDQVKISLWKAGGNLSFKELGK